MSGRKKLSQNKIILSFPPACPQAIEVSSIFAGRRSLGVIISLFIDNIWVPTETLLGDDKFGDSLESPFVTYNNFSLVNYVNS